ncbi:MAG: thiamine pyrophosphate-dependent dehydrogenase E1 component subunit alpha [Acidimicrobiales bacterium]
MPEDLDLYRGMYRIRRFEETVLDRFSSGVFHGTTHTYCGQEADAVAVLSAVAPEDVIVSNHRCHGHFLAYGGDMTALFAELMGRTTGVCGGVGGSQHLQWRNFYSNGILGGTIPVATGMAVAEARKGGGAMAVAFTGDGALGEGVVYESLNLAALWSAPILYVVENNQVAQTTPIHLALAGGLAARFEAFGVVARHLDTSDVVEILEVARALVAEIRSGGGPRALVIDTRRFGPHSKGDDPRPPEELARMREERDPLTIHGGRMAAAARAQIESEVDAEVALAFMAASAAPPAEMTVAGSRSV